MKKNSRSKFYKVINQYYLGFLKITASQDLKKQTDIKGLSLNNLIQQKV